MPGEATRNARLLPSKIAIHSTGWPRSENCNGIGSSFLSDAEDRLIDFSIGVDFNPRMFDWLARFIGTCKIALEPVFAIGVLDFRTGI